MADLKMIYEKDAPQDALNGKTVAVLGFGSQGHDHQRARQFSHRAASQSLCGISAIVMPPLVVDDRSQPQTSPGIVSDEIQIDQGHQRLELVARAMA